MHVFHGKTHVFHGKAKEVDILAAALTKRLQSIGYTTQPHLSICQGERQLSFRISNVRWYYWLGGQAISARITVLTRQDDVTCRVHGGLWIDKILLALLCLVYNGFLVVLPAVLVGFVRQVSLLTTLDQQVEELKSAGVSGVTPNA